MGEKPKRYGPQALRSGLAYGVGLTLGAMFAGFLFRVTRLELFTDFEAGARLLIGLILAFVIAGLAGVIGGFAGGYSLIQIDQGRPRWGYAWRSAISIGIPFGLSLYPILMIFSLLAFYNADDPGTIAVGSFVIVGVLFGIMASAMMSLLSIGRRGFSSLIWAGMIGFGLGGSALGLFLRLYIYSIRNAGVGSGQRLWALLGFFAFGLLGGIAWGYVFARLGDEERPPISRTSSKRRWVVLIVVIIILVIILRPVIAAVGDLLTPQSANLARVLEEDAEGVHWSDPQSLADKGEIQPTVFANGDQVAVVWGNESAIYYSSGDWDRLANMTSWKEPVQVSAGAEPASMPQIVLDEIGQGHVVWTEDGRLLTAVCTSSSCSEPLIVSRPNPPTCANEGMSASNPALSITIDGTLLAVWQNEKGVLLYNAWSADGEPLAEAADCVFQMENMGNPRLVASADGRFVLVYQNGASAKENVSLAEYSAGQWGSAKDIGIGHLPSVYVAGDDTIHAAWCNLEGLVTYWNENSREVVADLPCLSRPELAEDNIDDLHISWYANEVENSAGYQSDSGVLYESILRDSAWERPSIVSTVERPVQPAMTESGGDLHLVWTGEGQPHYSSQIQYDCDGFELSNAGEEVYNIARMPRYRTEDTVVPYCRNQYDRLIIAPNPDPAFSDEPSSTNGPFDRLAELVEEAQYEVLFSNMWYDEDVSGNSPGRVLADAVAALYENLAAHPEQYPRGITVRILLGHPPESTRGEFAGQIWNVLNDLRDAGLPEMQNEALGWSVEVANFEGTIPHSHIKSLIVDGKTAVAAGFNMSYDHFPEDHPSELGNGRFDLGIQVTGPVAQDTRRMFDDLWDGANRLYCSDFYPRLLPWQSTCFPRKATVSHVPEVMKYYLTQGDAAAFSMYRTEARNEADQQIIAALASAEKSIDAIHVNFTSEMICDLNLLYDQVCTSEQLLPYMEAILDAVEENGTQTRIMIKSAPIDGVESGVHLGILNDSLVERGISDFVEVRLFDGPMHPKTTLIDDEFLIVGSQNFHYSAFGEGIGLAEYSLGVEDTEVVKDFQSLFEYQWERAVPVD